jgi:hypothetical protein
MANKWSKPKWKEASSFFDGSPNFFLAVFKGFGLTVTKCIGKEYENSGEYHLLFPGLKPIPFGQNTVLAKEYGEEMLIEALRAKADAIEAKGGHDAE